MIAEPPLLSIVPHATIELDVIEITESVVITGKAAACDVLKLTSSPYAVPMLLVA